MRVCMAKLFIFHCVMQLQIKILPVFTTSQHLQSDRLSIVLLILLLPVWASIAPKKTPRPAGKNARRAEQQCNSVEASSGANYYFLESPSVLTHSRLINNA